MRTDYLFYFKIEYSTKQKKNSKYAIQFSKREALKSILHFAKMQKILHFERKTTI